jgi:hypothetical protein
MIPGTPSIQSNAPLNITTSKAGVKRSMSPDYLGNVRASQQDT